MSPEFGLSNLNRLAEAPIMWLGCMLLVGLVGMIFKVIDESIP